MLSSANIDVGGQEGFQRDRRRNLAGADQVRGQLIDLLMQRLVEVHRFEEIGNPIERLVVDQDCAEQRLFCLKVMRCAAVLRRRGVGEFARCQIDGCHNSRSKKPGVSKRGNAVMNEDSRTRRYIWHSQKTCT